MSSGSAFFILIPAMYALFTLALTTIAFFDRRLVAARWAAFGFLIAGISITVDGMREPGGDRWIAWFTVATHFIPLLIMIQAFVSRHGRSAPKFTLALVALACVMVMPNMPWAPPYWLRGVIVQAVCSAIICAGLPILWSLRRRSTLDYVVFGVILAAAMSYIGKTVAIYLNPIGQSVEGVVAFYEGLNIIFHSASALMGMAVGIVLLMTIGFDIVRLRIEEGEVDQLTQIGNRRALDRHIDEDTGGARPVGSVILVDLDHFKSINDTYGHSVGDDVLRKVATRIDRLLGKFGGVYRMGGEEFAVLLDKEHSEVASALAISVRKAIANTDFVGAITDLNVTASVGFHLRESCEPIEQCIKRADHAVYCAKRDGRNRVVGAVRENGLEIMKAVA